MTINVNEKVCVGCSFCDLMCPGHALKVSESSFTAEVNRDLCTDCLLCLNCCPVNAIRNN